MNMPERHYIIGYLGAQTRKEGEALARLLQCPLLFVDDEIERLDGRSIKRICMINGEHAYRNKEFEILSKLDDPAYDLGLAKNEVYPDRLVQFLTKCHLKFCHERILSLSMRMSMRSGSAQMQKTLLRMLLCTTVSRMPKKSCSVKNINCGYLFTKPPHQKSCKTSQKKKRPERIKS